MISAVNLCHPFVFRNVKPSFIIYQGRLNEMGIHNYIRINAYVASLSIFRVVQSPCSFHLSTLTSFICSSHSPFLISPLLRKAQLKKINKRASAVTQIMSQRFSDLSYHLLFCLLFLPSVKDTASSSNDSEEELALFTSDSSLLQTVSAINSTSATVKQSPYLII